MAFCTIDIRRFILEKKVSLEFSKTFGIGEADYDIEEFDIEAYYILGKMYLEGEIVKEDINKGGFV